VHTLARLSDRTILQRGFRPFFVLAAAYGCVYVPIWLVVLSGMGPMPGWNDPITWHAHEMLFGMVVAAIAGFLLTSVPVWTQRPPVVGTRLAILVGLWLFGRAAMLLAGVVPPLVARRRVPAALAGAHAVARRRSGATSASRRPARARTRQRDASAGRSATPSCRRASRCAASSTQWRSCWW
jgi:uncharacterized protein involved in response to NO